MKVNLQIWDTAGQERMRAIASAYYRQANGALLVYDICSKETFDRLPFWIKELRDNADEKIKIIMLGNKVDLADERQVPLEEARAFAQQRGYYYMEVSAKTNANNCVMKAFQELVKSVLVALKPDEISELRSNSQIRKDISTQVESAKTKDQELAKRKKCCQYL